MQLLRIGLLYWDVMKIVLSLNSQDRLYDYISMGIDVFVLGGEYSLYCPYSFSIDKMKLMIDQYQHCLFYVSINALYDQYQIYDIENYLKQLSEIGIYGLLFQDFGILQIVKENHYSFDMIYSPETLNTNACTLNTLKAQGISGAFISRVISLQEQIEIKDKTEIPLMIHGHGVEYIAASKRQLLTNYQKASQLTFDLLHNDSLTIQARNSEYKFQIYEDEKGTHIFSQTRLYTLDLLNQIYNYDFLYIETLMMKDEEAVEIAALYSEALKSYQQGKYNQNIKEYMNLLFHLNTPLNRGFLFDQTVYKLEDVRKMDNEKRESNH